MKDWNQYLKADIGEGTASLTVAAGNYNFIFLGASCVTTAPKTFGRLTALTVVPRASKQDIIALALTAWAHERRGNNWHGNFLLVASIIEEGRPIVFPNHRFVPRADRLGEIIGQGDEAMLCINVGERRFVYPPLVIAAQSSCEHLTKAGYFVVDDGNVLCRYLIGDASAEEVEKAVVARPNEKSVFEQIKEAKRQAEELETWRQKATAQQLRHVQTIGHLNKKFKRTIAHFREIANGTEPFIRRRWNKSRAIVERLDEQLRQEEGEIEIQEKQEKGV